VRILYGIKLTDEATCYKMFRTADLRDMNLQCERFEFCPEVTAKAANLELSIDEVPVRYLFRSAAEGKKLTCQAAASAVYTLTQHAQWSRLIQVTLNIRVSVGLLLFCAGIAKTLTANSVPELLIVIFEIALSIWLVSGWQTIGAATTALGLFAVFCGYNVASVAMKDRSCGCLGIVAVEPWALLLLDSIVVCGLAMCLLRESSGNSKFSLTGSISLLVVCGVLLRLEVSSLRVIGSIDWAA